MQPPRAKAANKEVLLGLMDVLIGLLIAFGGVIAGYLLEKGSLASLLLPSPVLIVIVGTIGAVLASYGIKDTVDSFKDFMGTLSKKNEPDPATLIKKLSEMTDRCRKEGLLVLQTMLNDADIANDKYLLLKEGMVLILDMKDSEQIENVLESDIESYTAKRQLHVDVFMSAVGLSPTLGIIGTVMGLVQVLSNISNAESLTQHIATAFIATLYGIIFANLVYLPLGNQIKKDMKRHKLFKQIIVEGISLVASGESSRNLENKLSLYYQAFPKYEKKYKEGITN